MLNQHETKTLVALICKEQIELVKSEKYDSIEYLELEQLKVKLKEIIPQ